MVVLGIHCGHDSSCAVVKDGSVIADAQEERFNRVKHSTNVPTKALAYCMKEAGISNINECDYVAVGWNSTPGRLAILLGLPTTMDARSLAKSVLSFVGLRVGSMGLRPPIYIPDHTLKDPGKLVNVEHHLAHAASAHYTRSNAAKCLVFTIDGAGDQVSTAVWEAEDNTIRPLEKLYREASIGWAYSIVTEALHWWHVDGEGKTMGLAPYGDYEKCRGVLDHIFPVMEGRRIISSPDLGESFSWDESGATQFHFELARELERTCEECGRANVAAEAQRKLEECIMGYVFGWIEKTGIKRTAYSGGVFLNVKLNQRIWNSRAGRIKEQHIFPNCGDSGLAVGAALDVYYRHNEFHGTELDNLYWGPGYSDEEIEDLLKTRKLPYIRTDDPSAAAAELLAQGKIVGWFQGRMESGPRALGNRSILMSPCKAENKDIINASVKYREAFRPFCPSILHEKGHEYLDDLRDEFFMITSFDFQENQCDKMPAVVHVDGTGRPQLVTKEMNERYWHLINEFGKHTGTYAVLNTSMNIRGEPMVCSPSDAIRCLYDTGMDTLILGSFALSKPDRSK